MSGRGDVIEARKVVLVNEFGHDDARTEFEALPWSIDDNCLTLHWSGGDRVFTEQYEFPASLPNVPWARAVVDLLAAIASLSYAKAFAPAVVSLGSTALTVAGRRLVESAFGPGMAEFSFHTRIPTPVVLAETLRASDVAPGVRVGEARPLIPLGGGRDSAVVGCALEPLDPVLLSIGGGLGARQVAAALGRELFVVRRVVDRQILDLNDMGAPNGHIPITAITMLVSVLAAGGLGAHDVVMANEASSSAPTRQVGHVSVNHQHSKSEVFEILLHEALESAGSPVRCFSALRNRDDTEISRVFATRCGRAHRAVISCNRVGVVDPSRRSNGWCGDCPKCRSVFLSLAPHMMPADLEAMFGSDLLAVPSQTSGFAELLDESTKPFECVQTVGESRNAIWSLSHSATWSGHVVVAALADRGVARQSGPMSELGAHVPPRYRSQMKQFFA